jgi:hypothetical protein
VALTIVLTARHTAVAVDRLVAALAKVLPDQAQTMQMGVAV